MASIAPVTKEQYTFIANSCVPLNILSLISTIISCVTFGFIRIYYPSYADRVSFRLSFAALICDIGYSVHVLITLVWDNTPGFLCVYAWLTLFGWIDLSILYCAIVVIMVVIKLRSVDIDDDFDPSTSQLSGSPTLINKKVISSVVRRVVWYPVIPLVAQFCNSFLETYAYVNRIVSYPLLLLCTIGMSIQGLLNAIVFSQDIAVTRAFQAVKLHWWITNVNTYESLYPHLSHNKNIINELNRLGKSNDFIELKTLNCNKAEQSWSKTTPAKLGETDETKN
ncbi:16650_t:CDS:2 [Gigaspora rosea]|nr:16650_t:CDS:2 [Gigaspora rosea]